MELIFTAKLFQHRHGCMCANFCIGDVIKDFSKSETPCSSNSRNRYMFHLVIHCSQTDLLVTVVCFNMRLEKYQQI